MRSFLAALALGLLGLVLTAAPAHADRTCSGQIADDSVAEDLVVSEGDSCILHGTEIDGNVIVAANGALLAKGVSVSGNVQAKEHRRVTVEPLSGNPSKIEGSVQFDSGGVGYVRAAEIGGDLQVARNSGLLGAVSNKVGGSVQAFANQSRFLVFDNAVAGDLQCGSNEPAPYGGRNAVEGDAEGQCRELAIDSGGDPNDKTAPRIGLAGPVIGFAKETSYMWTRCNEACDLRAAGLIAVRDAFGMSRIRTGTADADLDAGQRRVLRLSLPSDKVDEIKRGVRSDDARVRMWVRVRATDESGNTATRWKIKTLDR